MSLRPDAANRGVPVVAGLGALCRFFFLLGLTAFGGPVAHLAIIDREAVQRRRWLSRDEFVDMIGLLNLIPGPNSTQMVMYFGYRHQGIAGMLAAGLGFILPAAVITLGLTYLYRAYGALPAGQAVLYGIQPVVVAVIAAALWQIVPKGVGDLPTAVIAAAALAAVALGASEIGVVLAAGLVGWLWFGRRRSGIAGGAAAIAALGLPGGAAAAGGAGAAGLASLGLAFLKIAITLYGTGYLLVAYMQGELVDRLGWLSNQQLLDVIAIGQMTPGPFLTTATAAGMLVAGWPGAVVATVAIFLPSFFLIALVGPRIAALRASTWGQQALRGVNAAVVALLLAVALTLALEIAGSWDRLVVAAVALLALVRLQVSAMLLVALGGLYGWVWHVVF